MSHKTLNKNLCPSREIEECTEYHSDPLPCMAASPSLTRNKMRNQTGQRVATGMPWVL